MMTSEDSVYANFTELQRVPVTGNGDVNHNNNNNEKPSRDKRTSNRRTVDDVSRLVDVNNGKGQSPTTVDVIDETDYANLVPLSSVAAQPVQRTSARPSHMVADRATEMTSSIGIYEELPMCDQESAAEGRLSYVANNTSKTLSATAKNFSKTSNVVRGKVGPDLRLPSPKVADHKQTLKSRTPIVGAGEPPTTTNSARLPVSSRTSGNLPSRLDEDMAVTTESKKSLSVFRAVFSSGADKNVRKSLPTSRFTGEENVTGSIISLERRTSDGDDEPVTSIQESETPRPAYVAMYPYDADDCDYNDVDVEDIVTFDVHDVIYDLGERRGRWMKGQMRESGEIGWFPSSHFREGISAASFMNPWKYATVSGNVDLVKELLRNHHNQQQQQQVPNESLGVEIDEDFDDDQTEYQDCKLYVAVYQYKATHDGDVSLNVGDVIRVLEINEDGWWHGTVTASNQTGVFPGSYVEPVESDDLSRPTTSGPNLMRLRQTASTDRIDQFISTDVNSSTLSEGDAVAKRSNKRSDKRSSKSVSTFFLTLPRRFALSQPETPSSPSTDPPAFSAIDKRQKKKKDRKKKIRTPMLIDAWTTQGSSVDEGLNKDDVIGHETVKNTPPKTSMVDSVQVVGDEYKKTGETSLNAKRQLSARPALPVPTRESPDVQGMKTESKTIDASRLMSPPVMTSPVTEPLGVFKKNKRQGIESRFLLFSGKTNKEKKISVDVSEKPEKVEILRKSSSTSDLTRIAAETENSIEEQSCSTSGGLRRGSIDRGIIEQLTKRQHHNSMTSSPTDVTEETKMCAKSTVTLPTDHSRDVTTCQDEAVYSTPPKPKPKPRPRTVKQRQTMIETDQSAFTKNVTRRTVSLDASVTLTSSNDVIVADSKPDQSATKMESSSAEGIVVGVTEFEGASIKSSIFDDAIETGVTKHSETGVTEHSVQVTRQVAVKPRVPTPRSKPGSTRTLVQTGIADDNSQGRGSSSTGPDPRSDSPKAAIRVRPDHKAPFAKPPRRRPATAQLGTPMSDEDKAEPKVEPGVISDDIPIKVGLCHDEVVADSLPKICDDASPSSRTASVNGGNRPILKKPPILKPKPKLALKLVDVKIETKT